MKKKEVGSKVEPASRGASLVFRFVCADHARRVYRGGGWFHAPAFARVAFRDWGGPSYRDVYLGFRLVRDEGGT